MPNRSAIPDLDINAAKGAESALHQFLGDSEVLARKRTDSFTRKSV